MVNKAEAVAILVKAAVVRKDTHRKTQMPFSPAEEWVKLTPEQKAAVTCNNKSVEKGTCDHNSSAAKAEPITTLKRFRRSQLPTWLRITLQGTQKQVRLI